MTTILTVGGSDGQRHCTATCHNAQGLDCDCCCGGKFHGAGSQAIAEAQESVGEITELLRANGLEVHVGEAVERPRLFELDGP